MFKSFPGWSVGFICSIFLSLGPGSMFRGDVSSLVTCLIGLQVLLAFQEEKAETLKTESLHSRVASTMDGRGGIHLWAKRKNCFFKTVLDWLLSRSERRRKNSFVRGRKGSGFSVGFKSHLNGRERGGWGFIIPKDFSDVDRLEKLSGSIPSFRGAPFSKGEVPFPWRGLLVTSLHLVQSMGLATFSG